MHISVVCENSPEAQKIPMKKKNEKKVIPESQAKCLYQVYQCCVVQPMSRKRKVKINQTSLSLCYFCFSKIYLHTLDSCNDYVITIVRVEIERGMRMKKKNEEILILAAPLYNQRRDFIPMVIRSSYY